MSNGPCRDCDFWKKQNRQTDGMFWGECRMMDTAAESSGVESLAFAYAEEEQNAWVSTREDFGCVMFEQELGGDSDTDE